MGNFDFQTVSAVVRSTAILIPDHATTGLGSENSAIQQDVADKVNILKRSLGFFRIAVTMMFWSAGAPIRWDKTDPNRPGVTLVKSKVMFVLCILRFTLFALYQLFLGIRLFQVVSTGGSFYLQIHLITRQLTFLCMQTFTFHSYFRWRDIPVFLKECLTIFDRLHGIAFLRLNREIYTKGCSVTLGTFWFVALMNWVQNIARVVKHPQEKYLITSLLENPHDPSVTKIRWTLTVFHIVSVMMAWFTVMFYLHIFQIYSWFLVNMLRRAQFRHVISYCKKYGVPHSRTKLALIQIYRQLQVLNNEFKHCFQKGILLDYTIFGIMLAFTSALGAISLEGAQRVRFAFLSGISILCCKSTYRKMGQVNSSSVTLLRSWSGSGLQFSRKTMKSFRPLQVMVGSWYCVKRSTVLHIYKFILECTVTLLLAGRFGQLKLH